MQFQRWIHILTLQNLWACQWPSFPGGQEQFEKPPEPLVAVLKAASGPIAVRRYIQQTEIVSK